VPVEVEAEDCKAAIDQKCHPKCTTVWEVYKACETRIEEKAQGNCAGFYMDYFKCIDKCAVKTLFKELA